MKAEQLLADMKKQEEQDALDREKRRQEELEKLRKELIGN